MPPSLPTAELLSDCVETFGVECRHRSRSVYHAALGAVVAALAGLVLVRVPVSVQARGIIRPAVERRELLAPVSGTVALVGVVRGQGVRVGDTLFIIRDRTAEPRSSAAAARIARLQGERADLAALLEAGDAVPLSSLRTVAYRAALGRVGEEMRDAAGRRDAQAARSRRAHALAERGLAPRTDAEAAAHELSLAESALNMVRSRARAAWIADRDRVEQELEDMGVEAAAAVAEAERLVVRAPLDGTIEEVAGFAVGSFVPAAAPLVTLSPGATLVAEVAVPPDQVGLVRVGAEARLQVDAFDSHDWGTLAGRVTSISHDYVETASGPSFRVMVALPAPELALPDGTRATLRKGMTLTARFIVARRSLWQLLRDRSSDWVNPWQGGTRPSPAVSG